MRTAHLTALLLIAVAIGLTACGRRGTVEPPPQHSPEPGVVEPEREPLHERSFILDWLIE